MAWRITIFWGAVLTVGVALPIFGYIAIKEGILVALGQAALACVVLALYIGVIWLLIKFVDFLASIFYYPIVRLLARGSIKPSRKPGKKPN